MRYFGLMRPGMFLLVVSPCSLDGVFMKYNVPFGGLLVFFLDALLTKHRFDIVHAS